MPSQIRRIGVASLFFTLIPIVARAESFGPHFDYTVGAGVYPFLALPLVAFVYLLRRKTSWRLLWHSMLVLLCMLLMAIFAIRLAGNIFPWYMTPMSWLMRLMAYAVVRLGGVQSVGFALSAECTWGEIIARKCRCSAVELTSHKHPFLAV